VSKEKLFERYRVLKANAGSGKTFSLVTRYLTLIFRQVPPNKIFALTFTRKATKEMFDRVVSSLKNPSNSDEVREVAKRLNLSQDEVEKIAKDALSTLLNSDLKISTIDSLNHSILKRFSHYLNILPNFKIVENIDEKRFQEEFLDRVYRDEKSRNIFLTIERLDSKLKTENIFKELKFLFSKEVELYDIRKKFINLDIEDNLQEIREEIFTLAKLIAKWFLNENELSNAGKKAVTFSNFDELLNKGWLSKDSLSDYNYFKKVLRDRDTSNIDSAFLVIKNLLDRYFDTHRNLIFKNLFQLFEFYLEEREKFLKREGKLSFDDINHLLTKLIYDKKLDSNFIYFRLDSRIEHILIDEFQDTSLLQWRVLEPLVDDILSGGSGEDKSFFYVGDTMQSLYRFRGGFSKLFDEIPKEYPQIEIDSLKYNYRSKEKIVNFVNEVFKTKQKIGDKKQEGGAVHLKRVEDTIDGAVERVLELVEYGISPEDIAVICSRNQDIDEITTKLEDRGLEVSAETSLSINEHPPVKAVINYILYLYYINDKDSSFYLKNFQAIIGINPQEEFQNSHPLTKEQFNSLTLYEVAVKIFDYFQLFDGDENSMRFLEKLQTYQDIDEFIYTYKFNSAKMVRSVERGVNLITIHKSKGLQFEHIVFVDFSTQRQPYGSKTVIQYNGIQTKDIAWKLSGLKYKYQRLEDIEKSENELQREDDKNRIYVGMTRAKKSLSIIMRNQKSTLADFGIDEGIVNRYIGDIKKEIEATEEKRIEDESNFIFEFQENHYGYQHKIDNKIEEDSEIEEKEFNLEEEWENFQNIQFGNALHSTIEIMDNFKYESLDIALSNIRNRFSHTLDDSSFQLIKRRIETMIASKDFQKIIDGGSISKEVGYVFDGKQFYIDMLVEKDDEVVVCDFKSGFNRDYHQKYIAQVQNYMKIIRETNGKDREVSGYLIYPFEKDVRLEKVAV